MTVERETDDGRDSDDRLRQLWTTALGVAVHDGTNFFAAGGDSLRAALLVAKVNRTFGVKLALRDLFTHPTYVDFAAQLVSAATRDPAPAITGDSDHGTREVRLSYMQQHRLLRMHRAARNGRWAWSYPVELVCQIDGAIDDDAVTRAVHAVVRRHDALRTGFRLAPGAETWEPVMATSPHVTVERVSEPDDSGHGRRKRVLGHLAALRVEAGSLDDPPLVRARLCRFSPTSAVLIIIVDHLVCDGWSTEILFEDLATALDGSLATRPAALQYSEWTRWQHDRLSGETGDALRTHWRRVFRGAVPYPDLALPRPEGPDPNHTVDNRGFHVDPAAFGQMRVTLAPLGLTPYMATLWAAARAWRDVSGQHEAIIHTPCANRDMADADTTVGWLTHAMVLRLPATAATTVDEELVATRHIVLEALAHQELPLAELIKEIQPQLYASPVRIPRLYFSYRPQYRDRIPLANGSISRFPLDEQDTVADAGLSFLAREKDGGLSIRITFDPRTVRASYVESLVKQMRVRLAAVSGTPLPLAGNVT